MRTVFTPNPVAQPGWTNGAKRRDYEIAKHHDESQQSSAIIEPNGPSIYRYHSYVSLLQGRWFRFCVFTTLFLGRRANLIDMSWICLGWGDTVNPIFDVSCRFQFLDSKLLAGHVWFLDVFGVFYVDYPLAISIALFFFTPPGISCRNHGQQLDLNGRDQCPQWYCHISHEQNTLVNWLL